MIGRILSFSKRHKLNLRRTSLSCRSMTELYSELKLYIYECYSHLLICWLGEITEWMVDCCPLFLCIGRNIKSIDKRVDWYPYKATRIHLVYEQIVVVKLWIKITEGCWTRKRIVELPRISYNRCCYHSKILTALLFMWEKFLGLLSIKCILTCSQLQSYGRELN
jgi:hypothetical protein